MYDNSLFTNLSEVISYKFPHFTPSYGVTVKHYEKFDLRRRRMSLLKETYVIAMATTQTVAETWNPKIFGDDISDAKSGAHLLKKEIKKFYEIFLGMTRCQK